MIFYEKCLHTCVTIYNMQESSITFRMTWQIYTIVDWFCQNLFLRAISHRRQSNEMQWKFHFKQNI